MAIYYVHLCARLQAGASHRSPRSHSAKNIAPCLVTKAEGTLVAELTSKQMVQPDSRAAPVNCLGSIQQVPPP